MEKLHISPMLQNEQQEMMMMMMINLRITSCNHMFTNYTETKLVLQTAETFHM
jgi:hypothetical protein